MNTNNTNKDIRQKDNEILDDALEAFRKETQLNPEKGHLETRIEGKSIDAIIKIETHTRIIEYFAEIKSNLNNAHIAKISLQQQSNPGKWLIITQYISTQLAKKMKELNIQFIDTAGNAYLNEFPLFIFIHGNRAINKLIPNAEEGMLGVAELKVIFALLYKKNLESASYREIANTAKVALGTVSGMFKDLTRQGYILDFGTRMRRFQKKKELFDRWTIAYAEKLRPKTLIGRYTTDKNSFWENTNLTPHHAYWGGEVAANKLTHYLKPDIITIYASRPVNDLVLELRLCREKEGKVEIRERFWKSDTEQTESDIVPPLLVYADLIATADKRNVETAKMIYEEFIDRHLRKD
jgi:hypothetical protein